MPPPIPPDICIPDEAHIMPVPPPNIISTPAIRLNTKGAVGFSITLIASSLHYEFSVHSPVCMGVRFGSYIKDAGIEILAGFLRYKRNSG